jgi:hypothetical protein
MTTFLFFLRVVSDFIIGRPAIFSYRINIINYAKVIFTFIIRPLCIAD